MLKREEKKVIGVYKNSTPISRIYKNGYLVFGSFPEPPVDEYEGYNFVFEWTGADEIRYNFYEFAEESPYMTNLPAGTKVSFYSPLICDTMTLIKLPEDMTDWSNLFNGLDNCEYLDMSKLNASNVTSMKNLLHQSKNLQQVNFGKKFNTSNVTNMYGMFSSCSGLTSVDVSMFNTSNVTDMQQMFANCDDLVSLNISNFNTNSVTTVKSMFYNMDNLETLILGDFHCPIATVWDGFVTESRKLKSFYWNSFGESQALKYFQIHWSTDLGTVDDTLQYTFVVHSYDRATNGYGTCTVEFAEEVETRLTQEEIAAMTAKGYSVSFN